MINVSFPYDEDLYTLDELEVIYQYKKLLESKLVPFSYSYYNISPSNNLHIRLHKNPSFYKNKPVLGKFSKKDIAKPAIDIYALDFMSIEESIKIFFHEFIHYKQWIFDEYRDKDLYKLDYLDRPWEKEAWEKQETMFNDMIHELA